MSKYRVGFLVGSLARGSINRQLATALVRHAPADLVLNEIPIRDLPLYSYDYDSDSRRWRKPSSKRSPTSTPCCS